MRSLPVVVILALVFAVTPALAHTNTVEADSQVSSNGTVVVEGAFSFVNGYVAVHRDEQGAPGEVISHTTVSPADGHRLGVRVPIDDQVWEQWPQGANRSLWVALHRESGETGFQPTVDPIHEGIGGPVVTGFTVRKGNHDVWIRSGGIDIQTVSTDAVALREVALGEQGRVVVRAEGSDGAGEILGVRSFAAGVHSNVTVPVDGDVFASRGRTLTVVAQLYPGSGSTVTAGEQPISVAGDPIQTTVTVERVGSLDSGTETASRFTTFPERGDSDSVGSPTPDATAETGPGFGRGFAFVAILVGVSLATRSGVRE